jgi:hypothetical protein
VRAQPCRTWRYSPIRLLLTLRQRLPGLAPPALSPRQQTDICQPRVSVHGSHSRPVTPFRYDVGFAVSYPLNASLPPPTRPIARGFHYHRLCWWGPHRYYNSVNPFQSRPPTHRRHRRRPSCWRHSRSGSHRWMDLVGENDRKAEALEGTHISAYMLPPRLTRHVDFTATAHSLGDEATGPGPAQRECVQAFPARISPRDEPHGSCLTKERHICAVTTY